AGAGQASGLRDGRASPHAPARRRPGGRTVAQGLLARRSFACPEKSIPAVLTLRCDRPGHPSVPRLGPAPYFRLVGDSLRAGPEDTEVGCYRNGRWQVRGHAFLTLTTQGPAVVRFESGGTYGPFPSVEVLAGTLWHGAKADRLLASYDEESDSWFSYPDGHHFPPVVLSPAG